MSSVKFFKSETDESNVLDFFDLLSDPIRSKIMFEILIAGEVTADIIVTKTGKSRSTISHHLKKLVVGGLLEVHMSPTGKTKHYRFNREIGNQRFVTDKKELLESPIEESSKFILDNVKVAGVFNQVYSNIFADTVRYLQENQPFDEVTMNEDNIIEYHINKKKATVPTIMTLFVSEEAATFVESKLDELFAELNEKFGPYPEKMLENKSDPIYILSANIFPHFKDE